MHRRDFLKQATVTAAVTLSCANASVSQKRAEKWNSGSVVHLLPTVNHERMLLKTSFKEPLAKVPYLHVDNRRFAGEPSDTGRYFWRFHADGLEPGRLYNLTLVSHEEKPFCDSWKLQTFPSLTDRSRQFRLMIYSCAGGHPQLVNRSGRPFYLEINKRIRLLERGLSFEPDAVIANGDHIYWDQRQRRTFPPEKTEVLSQMEKIAGGFDPNLPVWGSENEQVLKRAAGPQIAELYGTLLRSVPVFFLQDDHDYFEDDQATDKFVTLPPDYFSLRLGQAVQRLYYPEFLPDQARPLGLPTVGEGGFPPRISQSFGTLRFGQLVEIQLFDCRRYVTLNGPTATLIPRDVEEWLKARMAAPAVAHVVNVPSLPVGWSAGKWGDWYPDILDRSTKKLTIWRPKPYWQQGWNAQHDRLLKAASNMRERIPLFLNGDLHATAAARLYGSNGQDFKANPITTVLTGSLGTGAAGWVSLARGIGATPPSSLDMEEMLSPFEENGFLLVDFTAEKVVLKFFRLGANQPDDAIDDLQPFHTLEIKRPG